MTFFDAFRDNPGTIIALITSVSGMVLIGSVISMIARARVKNVREREQTKRELAAYIAEGSLTAADAERILAGGPPAQPEAGAGEW